MWYIVVGIVAGIILAAVIAAARRAQPVLLPVLVVLGVAGLTVVVQWQKHQERVAREATERARYEHDAAALPRQPAQPVTADMPPPGPPPRVVPLSSPLQRPPSGAAAPAAVPPLGHSR
ncbi:MAG TPA: hypothetical protein VFA12_13760 [Stellaceae bacterium]|nr:hypothetical protein [Stellaceae bacterium]